MMNVIPDNRPGPTTNPQLMVNTGQDGNTNSFITPTLMTNHQNHQGNGNTIASENTIPEADKQINTRLVKKQTRAHHWKPQQPVTQTTTFQTDASIQTTESTSIRVCTPIKIDPTLTTTTKTIGIHGKTTLTEPATIVVPRDI